LEFSFDRSKDSHLRTNTQPKTEVKPEPVAAQAAPAETYDDGIDTSTIANERLRKAIERNRARQAERNRMRPPVAEPQMQAQEQAAPQQETQQSTEQASLFGRQAPAEETAEATSTESARPRSERAQMRTGARSSTVVTRRSVARPDDTDFTPVKRAPRKVASQISYATTGSKKKNKQLDPTLLNYFVKGCWIFCVVLILRLIFANGGVTDFYSRRSILNDRSNELDRIKKENMQLVHEIERMQSDTAFQKKLVRDNLGFIAADEFLILFPKEKSIQ
jgi:cell division protein FtsB